jgi:hypothetical protein
MTAPFRVWFIFLFAAKLVSTANAARENILDPGTYRVIRNSGSEHGLAVVHRAL